MCKCLNVTNVKYDHHGRPPQGRYVLSKKIVHRLYRVRYTRNCNDLDSDIVIIEIMFMKIDPQPMPCGPRWVLLLKIDFRKDFQNFES